MTNTTDSVVKRQRCRAREHSVIEALEASRPRENQWRAAELLSPERMVKRVQETQRSVGRSYDLRTGYDLSQPAAKYRVGNHLKLATFILAQKGRGHFGAGMKVAN